MLYAANETMNATLALPALDALAVRDELLSPESFVAPRNTAEQQLASIWRAALNVDRIGVDDNFFELGGESMIAVVICGEVQRITGRKTETSLFLDAPTIATFAMAMEGDLRQSAARSLIEILPGGARTPLVLIHGFDGQVMFVRRRAWMLPADQPLFAIQARGLDGQTPVHTSCEAMVEDYAAQFVAALGARRELQLGGFCTGALIAIAVAHRLRAAGVTIAGLVLIDPSSDPRRPRNSLDVQRALLREWTDTLGERIAPFVQWHPEAAKHYGPDGAGLRQARRVMRSLAGVYAKLRPAPIDVPMLVIWSQQRAERVGNDRTNYYLSTGPCRSVVVAHPTKLMTHVSMLRDGIATVASVLRTGLGLPAPEGLPQRRGK